MAFRHCRECCEIRDSHRMLIYTIVDAALRGDGGNHLVGRSFGGIVGSNEVKVYVFVERRGRVSESGKRGKQCAERWNHVRASSTHVDPVDVAVQRVEEFVGGIEGVREGVILRGCAERDD